MRHHINKILQQVNDLKLKLKNQLDMVEGGVHAIRSAIHLNELEDLSKLNQFVKNSTIIVDEYIKELNDIK